MSAQYRPYRDEESVDGLEAAWSDNEPGSIRIYEKTTEEIPFSASKRSLLLKIAVVATVGILGFLLGYFAPFHPSGYNNPPITGVSPTDALISQDVESHSAFEDATIRDKILQKIDGRKILQIIKQYDNTNRLPGSKINQHLADDIYNRFKHLYNFDDVTSISNSFKIVIPSKRNIVKLLDKSNNTIYMNSLNETWFDDAEIERDFGPFLPMSQSNSTSITSNQILYVNKGTKEDYKTLESLLKVNETEGKVFVIRQDYHGVHDVVITAQRLGAVAVLLFPDPEIFGTDSSISESFRIPKNTPKVHPTAWGNYGDLISNSSNPLIEILKSIKELKITIPVIPISLGTAQVILRGLSGSEAPFEWNVFDFTLYIGPGYKDDVTNQDNRDKIHIDFHNEETSIVSPTVTGIIKGSTESDRYILIGSRRDSLTRGVLDSLSGTAVMLEIARVFGSLLKEGWRPKRTIIFNSFGSETLNLIGSNHWLESYAKLLQLRTVAYVNCELVVIGNRTISIAASPLLHQVIYNATKEITNPRGDLKQPTLYDSWLALQSHEKKAENQMDKKTLEFLESLKLERDRFPDVGDDDETDSAGLPGSMLNQYKHSALVLKRPTMRRLDMQSLYSPFFVGLGVPIVDVKYVSVMDSSKHKQKSSSSVLEYMPLIGTKYDNLKLLTEIDPGMKFHKSVAQLLAEMVRDLSDSTYIPFNVLDYALTLKDSYNNFIQRFGTSLNDKFVVEIKIVKKIIENFTEAAARLHHRQDQINIRDALKIRQINDQLIALERAFMETDDVTYSENKHAILPYTNDNMTAFPSLVEWLTILDGFDFSEDIPVYHEILKMHFKGLIYTLSHATNLIGDFTKLPLAVDKDDNEDMARSNQISTNHLKSSSLSLVSKKMDKQT